MSPRARRRTPHAGPRAAAAALLAGALGLAAGAPADGPALPVPPEVLVDEPFRAAEGIAFNGEGRLFATANRALWEVYPDGTVRRLFEMDSNLGLAAWGERNLLVADFGPTNAFREDRNDDGVVWLATPEGERRAFARGIGDPNAIVVRPGRPTLVSDDATADIYAVDADGAVRLFSTAVSHPNGLLLSDDGRTLYVARIFHSIRPVVFDDSVWAIALDASGTPEPAPPRLVFRTDAGGGPDGLAIDTRGRLYVSAPMTGTVWRHDPATGETVLIAEGMPGVAGLTFGRGAFDPHSIYAAATFAQGKGGKIYRLRVGVSGRN